jgi:hypothetical protein
MERLSGPTGLATAVSAALAVSPDECARTLLVFDFDRTLTNGVASPGETDLAKLVRGGEATVAALRQAQAAGVGLYIITARRPSRLTVEQIFASLDHAQVALSPFFPRGDEPPVEFRFAGGKGDGVSREKGHDVPLARGGCVYAADYQKAAAMAHIVQERGQEGLRVFFFDDSVVNAYEVGTATAQYLGTLAPSTGGPFVHFPIFPFFHSSVRSALPSFRPSRTILPSPPLRPLPSVRFSLSLSLSTPPPLGRWGGGWARSGGGR